MNKKIMPILLILVLAISSIGATFGADNVKLEGMDADKSIGNVGVMNLTNTTSGGRVNGLCVEKGQYIYIGDTVPVTPGTNGITNNNQVKQLVYENYRDDMTPQEGYDLQHAIWFFTDGIPAENVAQLDMIDRVRNNPKVIPDTNAVNTISEAKKL
ncbi:MAG: hypothetical protein Q8N08_04395, partial [Methanobacteriaceae archaeon]|nr:hypothetical protein [Methanobacteriaceae archaeon]